MKLSLVILIVLKILIVNAGAHNKYSKEVNQAATQPATENVEKIDFKTLDKPFRMNKINILWAKAQQRLTIGKLKSLYSELKLHDKEEIAWKRLRSEGKDKDGLKEAELRRKMLAIMDMYGLLEHFEEGRIRRKEGPNPNDQNETYENHINKSLFKDKKLNKLWSKAEVAGFTAAELAALKEEFEHHQNKIDEYYSILHETKEGPPKDDGHDNSIDDNLEKFNMLETDDDESAHMQKKAAKRNDYLDKVQLLREHHRGLKEGYDHLTRLTAQGRDNKEFLEPKVQGLWRIAVESDFKDEELESLRVELMHYENRLLKLRHLHAEALLHEEKHKEKSNAAGEKTNGHLLLQDNIKKQARKVEKLHMELENKILMKHIEL